MNGGNDLVSSITQQIDDGIVYPFENISYDHLGRVVVKQTAAADILNEYNMRGFLNHIGVENFNSSLPPAPPSDPYIFDEKIYYDTGFVNKFYNGNIAGIKWQMQGGYADTQTYGYSYDSLNRLSYAAYYRKGENDSKWRKDLFDYTVSNLTYDLNGNIKSMNQRGNIPSVGDMDILSYKYLPNSNQLQNVEDAVPVNSTSALPDFKNNSIAPNGTEYSFDQNGNMTFDANKGVTTTYTIFDKPDKITVANKGEITYVYDGQGKLLQKRIHPTATGSDEKWDYMGNFVYKNDSLQYILNEEGRARPIAAAASTGGMDQKYVYDYFVKDHLGNVRSTVTATPISPQYLAGFELSQANIEQLVFDNVATVRGQKPGSTDPNDDMAAKLNGNDPSTAIGTSIMLRTMPGDRFNLSVDAFYDGDYQQDQALSGNDIARALMTTLTGGTDYSGVPVGELPANIKNIEGIFANPNLADQLNQLTSVNNDINAPKAHLNYLFFDDKFNLISSSSGSVQVATGFTGWQNLTPSGTGTFTGSTGVVQCNCSSPGYLIVYIDNQSIGKDVWFDHLSIGHYSSAVVAEDHYYPFGLDINVDESTTIAPNTKKYQGMELEKHFGLEQYETKLRTLDPQLGLFKQIDSKVENHYDVSPYASMGNDPALNVDPNGDDWATASAALLLTQEVSGVAGATGIGTAAIPFIEAVGVVISVWDLLDNSSIPAPAPVPRPVPAPAPHPVPAHAQPKPISPPTKTASQQSASANKSGSGVKSRSGGTYGGTRAGKDFTKKGKNDTWSDNKAAKGGKNECESCGMEVQRSPQSQKGVPTPEDAGQVDHIYPKSQGGNGSPDNGQILCQGCNNLKSDNLPTPKTP